MRGRDREKETVGKLKIRLTKNFILRRRSLDFLHRAERIESVSRASEMSVWIQILQKLKLP